MNAAINTAGTSDVNLAEDAIGERTLKAFKIPGFVDKVKSIQGYDIDNNLNIYVSSQYAPKAGQGKQERKIVKIPWGNNDDSNWTKVNLDNTTSLDINGCETEFEGIQVTGENNLYLTVAYHKAGTTVDNRIYKVRW